MTDWSAGELAAKTWIERTPNITISDIKKQISSAKKLRRNQEFKRGYIAYLQFAIAYIAIQIG